MPIQDQGKSPSGERGSEAYLPQSRVPNQTPERVSNTASGAETKHGVSLSKGLFLDTTEEKIGINLFLQTHHEVANIDFHLDALALHITMFSRTRICCVKI